MGKSAVMSDRFAPLALRAIWLSAPLWGGVSVSDGLGTGAVSTVAQVALWAGWGVALVAMGVPTTVSLTAIRLTVPAVAIGAVIAGRGPWWFVSLAGAIVAVGLTFSADVGQRFVDASSYGAEKRFPLRPPAGAVLAAPIAWALGVTGLVAGPLLLADRDWIAGGLVLVFGLPLAALTVRALHRLSRRFAVLVPAGLVVHDPIVLADTALFRRAQIERVGLAATSTTATDLTGGAQGLAIEVALVDDSIVAIAPSRRGERVETRAVRSVIFTPSRPGRLLAMCVEQRLV